MRTAIGRGKTHSLLSQPIKMRSPILFLPIATESAHPEIIGQDKDDVRLPGSDRQRQQAGNGHRQQQAE